MNLKNFNTSKVSAPTDFNRGVWQRIEALNEPTWQQELWEGLVESLLPRQAWQWAAIVCVLVFSLGVGQLQANDFNNQTESSLASLYSSSVNPDSDTVLN